MRAVARSTGAYASGRGQTAPCVARLLPFYFCLLTSAAAPQRREHSTAAARGPLPHGGTPEVLKTVEHRAEALDEQVPLDAVFRDESGREVRLGDYFRKGKPVVLALVYYECPMLCNQILNGAVGSLDAVYV